MNRSIKIRRLRREDIYQASNIVAKNYSASDAKSARSELQAMFGGVPFKPVFFVAEKRAQVVGFAGCAVSWADYSAYEIFWVNVLPEHQGKGIGEALVRHVIEYITAQEPDFILLTARDWRESFYREKFGFQSVGQKDGKHLMRLVL